jgi:hypothetical protein
MSTDVQAICDASQQLFEFPASIVECAIAFCTFRQPQALRDLDLTRDRVDIQSGRRGLHLSSNSGSW